MKKMTANKSKAKLKTLFLATLLGAPLVACAPEFDDPTMAVVKKPEILSIVLEPPEAAPGERVTASFLMADDRGAIEGNANLWSPVGPIGEMSQAQLDAALAELDLDLDALGEARLELEVPPASSFVFDKDGLSGQVISLFASVDPAPATGTPVQEIVDSLDELVAGGDFEAGIRTLVVSQRSNRNQNPVILGIRAGDQKTQETQLTLALSSDEDIAGARQRAADSPLVVKEGQELVFAVDVEDDGDADDALTYQWISTGGDFAGLRERIQEFEAPEYQELEPGDIDQSGLEDVDPRADPNLHPVWVIVRDNGEPGRLGQCFAELYVRVEPE